MGFVTILRWVVILCACAWIHNANAALLEEPIAIIMHIDSAKPLKKDDIVLLYKRKKLFWADGTKAQPVNMPANHPLRRIFSQAVLNHSPEELEKYWDDQYFHGISPPYVLASEEAVLRFVSETPGAIGYVSMCSVDARVKIALAILSGNRVTEDIPNIECKH